MVSIIKRRKGKEAYYYLRHNIRKNNKQKETYLGKSIPKNLEEIKQNFLLEFYRDEWLPRIKTIKKNYSKERRQIPKDVIKKEIETFSIKFTYNTQRIEGSTLSLKETTDLLGVGLTPSNKPVNDVKEAEVHQKLFFTMLKDKTDLSNVKIRSWHKKLFQQTKPLIAGAIRNYDVGIGGSKFIPPKHQAVSLLTKQFFSWYNKNKNKINPVELAALVHLKFVTVHPFGDGNGRITRLMVNFVLNKSGYPMLDIDYSDRRSYYNALERAQLSKNDVTFLQWFMRRYFKTHKKYLKTG